MAKSRRVYCRDITGAFIALGPDESNHVVGVLRMGIGDTVELFDGQGTTAAAAITSAKRKCVELTLAGTLRHSERPGIKMTLAFAVPKTKRLDWLLEKATELGASVLVPVIFARSAPGSTALSQSKRKRWLTHCISAAKQCGLGFLPELADITNLQTLLLAPTDSLRLMGDPSAESISLSKALADNTKTDIQFLIGPEGGLTEDEQSSAINAGFIPIRLGQTTLRVETAAIALLAGAIAVSE